MCRKFCGMKSSLYSEYIGFSRLYFCESHILSFDGFRTLATYLVSVPTRPATKIKHDRPILRLACSIPQSTIDSVNREITFNKVSDALKLKSNSYIRGYIYIIIKRAISLGNMQQLKNGIAAVISVIQFYRSMSIISRLML